MDLFEMENPSTVRYLRGNGRFLQVEGASVSAPSTRADQDELGFRKDWLSVTGQFRKCYKHDIPLLRFN